MSAPIFISTGSLKSGSGDIIFNASGLSQGIPSGIVRDDLLLLLCESYNETITAPAGWTEVGVQANQGITTTFANKTRAVRIGAFYKFTSGTETDVTVVDTGDHTTGQIVAFRNVDRKNFSKPSIFSSSFEVEPKILATLPSVTTTIPDCKIVSALALDRPISNLSGNFTDNLTNLDLTDITEHCDFTIKIANGGGGIACWSGTKSSPGLVSTSTVNNNTGSPWLYGYVSIILRPRRNFVSLT